MKRLIFALFSILSVMASQATTVKGRVYNSTYDEGEPFATIRVYKIGEFKPMVTIVTDDNGEFEIDLKEGLDYHLEFSAIGKENTFREFSVKSSDEIDLGDVTMKDDVRNLGELVVTAQRPLVQMTTDEINYNVSADNDSKTYTLLEMLRKVPMVSVDGEDNITVNGSSNFQIYVDGKPSLFFSGNPSQIFKSMPASSVQNIEVVTNPGARYDAEGVGGVINLVMNKAGGSDMADMKAYNVTLNLRGGNRGVGGNVYASGQTGKLTSSLNFIYNYAMMGKSEMATSRIQEDMVTETMTSSKPKLPFLMGNLNLNYDIDSLTSIGASFGANRFRNHYTGTINTRMSQNDNTFFHYLEDSDNRNSRMGLNGSVNLNRDFGMERNHQLSVTYQISYEDQKNYNNNDFTVLIPADFNMDNRESDSKMKTTEQIVLADFSSKIHNNKISVGLKGTFRNAKADNYYYLNEIFDSNGSLNYKNINNIGAAYGEYAFSNMMWNLKAGLRYEYTWQSISYGDDKMPGYKSRYGNLVPSASFGYNIRQNSNIGINYNMRISRPGISYLNPYVNQADPTQISYGNPNLDIEKTQNVSIVYNMFSRQFTLNATLSNAYTGNGIEQYNFMEDDVLVTTYGNIVKRNTTSLTTFINWRLGTKTGITLNGGISYLDFKSKELNASNHGWQGNVMLGLQQQLPWSINGNAYFIWSSKNRTLQGWNSGFRMLAVNFTRTFLNDNLGVSLGFNTGLNKGGKLHIENYVSTPTFSNKTSIRVPIASVNLGITFKFGSKVQVRHIKNNEIDNDFIDTRSQMETISNQGNL